MQGPHDGGGDALDCCDLDGGGDLRKKIKKVKPKENKIRMSAGDGLIMRLQPAMKGGFGAWGCSLCDRMLDASILCVF